MNLLKKIMHQRREARLSTLPVSLHQEILHTAASNIDANSRNAESNEKQASYVSKYFMELPNEIHLAVLNYLSYDDIAKLRRTCKLMNTLCSHLLNRGFQQLGIDIEKGKLRIKRELPRRESMRRSHRLSRLNDAYAGLDTRFSILTMTYRKFIDIKATCFIPGKVLDEFFRIIDILKKAHDIGGTLSIDIHELLKDLRDLSSMAMEHFEEHVQPSLTSTMPGPLTSSYFMSVHPLLRLSTSKTPSPTNDVCMDSCEWRKNVTDKLAQQNKIIAKQNSEIISLKSCIRQLVVVCTQLSTSVPTVEKEINDLLNVILDTLSLDVSTVPCDEPSASGNDMVGRPFSRERKRNNNHEDSRHNVKKRPRYDTEDDEYVCERLI